MTASTTEHRDNASKEGGGSYAPINGLNMYYEIHGTGQPLVLLHGAFSAIGSSFGKVLPGLAKTHKVIVDTKTTGTGVLILTCRPAQPAQR